MKYPTYFQSLFTTFFLPEKSQENPKITHKYSPVFKYIFYFRLIFIRVEQGMTKNGCE